MSGLYDRKDGLIGETWQHPHECDYPDDERPLEPTGEVCPDCGTEIMLVITSPSGACFATCECCR